jgi:short subunit dehydrogenase-like uncharacterized protein
MPKKIILFGATGYTGHNTAEAMAERGLKPVLAGRNREKLKDLSARLGGLETALADINDPASVAGLAGKRDILVSTVGPFTVYGEAALEAAVSRGAHYIDSTGEPGFIRKVFEDFGPRAASAGAALISACGYDYVPGNCAAGIALKNAGKKATRVDVGYYITGKNMMETSQGTAASLRYSILEPGKIWKSGTLVKCYGAAGVRTFTLDGRERAAILIPSTESFSLPKVFPHLKDVNVYMGWFGNASYSLRRLAAVNAALMSVPGYGALLKGLISLLPESGGKGPDSSARSITGSHIVSEAYDADGRILSRAELQGVNGYVFTFKFLAWAADMTARGKVKKTGAIGPIEAFGLDELIKGCGEAGLYVK